MYQVHEVNNEASWRYRSSTFALSLLNEDQEARGKTIPINSSNDSRFVNRLVDRENKFYQAKYPLHVQKLLPYDKVLSLFYASDPVLAIVNLDLLKGFFVLMIIFVTMTSLSAVPWYLMGVQSFYRDVCSVETNTFQRAFIFSSQVIMTIGFGTKDIFFGGCRIPTVVLTLHCIVSLILQSFMVGVIFQRLNKSTSRRHTIVFSNNAVIRRVGGRLYFMMQVCELRARQLVESHVRLYVARHQSVAGQDAEGAETEVLHTQTLAMRICQPNDDLGSKLLLSTPQVIVHEIDEHSPLRPPAGWSERQSSTATPRRTSHGSSAAALYESEGSIRLSYLQSLPFQRSNPLLSPLIDSRFNDVPLSSTLNSNNNNNNNNNNISSSSNDEDDDGKFVPSCKYQFPDIVKKGVTNIDIVAHNSLTNEKKQLQYEREKLVIQSFLESTQSEIVVLLEGVDTLTSHCVQSQHSYVSEEIKWDHFFAHCASVVKGWITVDFSKFHHLVRVQSEESYLPCSPSVN